MDWISIWKLSRQLGVHRELVVGIVLFHQVEVRDGPRGQEVRESDRQLITDLISSYRSRPKLSYMCGQTPRRKRKPAPQGPALAQLA